MMNRISRATSKNSNLQSTNAAQPNNSKDESGAASPAAAVIDTVEKKILTFVNPEKFIVQNNFIPQPSILLNQGAGPVGQGHQAQKFIESGENLTQERFTKSR